MAKKKSKLLRRLPLVGIFMLLISGLGLLMYPIVGNWYTEYTSYVAISRYDNDVQKAGTAAIKRFEQLANEYNRALARNEEDKLSVTDYDSMLAVSDSIAYIEIPKIGVYLPVYHGLSDDVLQKGIGHMEGTSLPVGGESTHCVLAGHTGLPSAKIFTDLDLMNMGDAFYVHVLDKVMKYEVDRIQTVLPDDLSGIMIEDGEDYVTLLTCTPYGINSHRLLVRGRRVPYYTQTMENTDPWPVYHASEEKIPVRTIVWYGGAGTTGAVIIIAILILVLPGRKKRKNKVGKTEENKEQ